MDQKLKRIAAVAAIVMLLAVGGCAAGSEAFRQDAAGFWAGLWHGVICVITFVIGLFTDSVRMYEPNNSGWPYDLGFLIGAMILLGGSCRGRGRRGSRRRIERRDWDELGRKIEAKVERGIRRWAEEAERDDRDWEEIGRTIEEKIKRELREWAED
jgi:hypothetical protein